MLLVKITKSEEVAISAPLLYNKYAYLINNTFVVPLDTPTDKLRIMESMDSGALSNYISSNNIHNFILDADAVGEIDWTETERINNVDIYLRINSQTPTPTEVQVSELKLFRTFFATYTLSQTAFNWENNASLSDIQKVFVDTLNYFKNGMTSSTLFDLDFYFPNGSTVIPSISDGGCGCGIVENNTSINYVGVCNAATEYRNKMLSNTVMMMGSIDLFWKQWVSDEMYDTIILYLNGIIKSNLPLNFNGMFDDLVSCSNISSVDAFQKRYQDMLRDVVVSLELLRDNKEQSRRNFVNDSLTNFGVIYPRMHWGV